MASDPYVVHDEIIGVHDQLLAEKSVLEEQIESFRSEIAALNHLDPKRHYLEGRIAPKAARLAVIDTLQDRLEVSYRKVVRVYPELRPAATYRQSLIKGHWAAANMRLAKLKKTPVGPLGREMWEARVRELEGEVEHYRKLLARAFAETDAAAGEE
jgi:hypothetical protein